MGETTQELLEKRLKEYKKVIRAARIWEKWANKQPGLDPIEELLECALNDLTEAGY